MQRYLIIVVVLTFAMLSSCKRYDEGPITFRTPENRIRRSWHLQSFTLDGKDSMDFMVRNKLDGEWSFGQARSDQGSDLGIYILGNSSSKYSGLWNIHDQDIFIEDINVKTWLDLYFGVFKIIKLTTKELKMQDTKSGAILYFRS